MQTTVTAAGPCRKTLKITIPPERVRSHLDEYYQQAAQQVRQKGFRPGKIPRRVLEQRFGTAILAEAKESLINRCFEDALREHKLAPVSRPSVEGLDDQPLDPEKSVEFSVHVEVRPEFQVAKTRGLELKPQDPAVTDEDVQQALAQIAGQKKTLRSVEEPVAEGDFAKGDLRFLDAQGNPVHERPGVQLNPRIPVAGTDPEQFAQQMIGAERGATVTIPLTYPDNFEKEAVRGQPGSIQFTIQQVMRVLSPAIDDELAKGFGFDSLTALQEDLHNRIGAEKQRIELRRQEEEMIRQLLAETQFEVPETMVEQQAQHHLDAYAKRLEENGAPKEEIEQRVAAARDEAKQDAEQRVRTFFLLDTIARQEKLFVTEGDLEAEFRGIAAQNDATPDQVREYYRENNLMTDLRIALMERKVREFLRENAQRTDK